jgi:RecA/RadA recombinase
MPVDPTSLTKALDAINKEYKEKGGAHYGNESSPVARVRSGIPMFDYVTGGGFPIGRVTRLFGGWSSAKSLLSWRCIREAQRMGMICVYYNLEQQYDPVFTASLGVDIDKLIVVEGQRIEEFGEKMKVLIPAAHVHVIDSRAAGSSIDELSVDLDKYPAMALKVRSWARVFDQVEDLMNDENLIIMIDQVRDAFGSGSEKPPGGRQMEHISDLTIHTKRAAWLWYDENGILDPDAKQRKGPSDVVEPDGWELAFKVIKSRVCRPNRTAKVHLDLNTFEFDAVQDLMRATKYFDLPSASYAGGYYRIPGEDKPIHGGKNFRVRLNEDPALMDRLIDELLDVDVKART